MIPSLYLIADIGLNHNGDFRRACELIFRAKQCGFNAVKFQLYDADKLTSDPVKRSLLHAGKFDERWLPDLRRLCDELELDLAVTPFYPEAVDIITPYVDFIKLGSYEICYLDLIRELATVENKIILSSGMAVDVNYLKDVYYMFPEFQVESILYCVSKYPCDSSDICFHEINSLKIEFPLTKIGWSDHSHDPNVIWAALMAGAKVIEMHFDIEGCGLEYNQGHVWNAPECFDLIHDIKSALKCFEPTTYVPDYSKRTNQQGRRP
jgi:sialic acid synthase SpsE